MAKRPGGWSILLLLASCATAQVQPIHPNPGATQSQPQVPAISPGTTPSGLPPQPSLSGAQRGQYVWEKMMEGVYMGAFGGPYGAAAGLVVGGLMGLFTADAHYAKLNTQIQSEQTKDKELEAQLQRELERQRELDAQLASAQNQGTVLPTAATSAVTNVEPLAGQKTGNVGAQASLRKTETPARPEAPAFKNVEIKDVNQDGLPDLWIYYDPKKPGEIVRQEEDTNGDSRVDTWTTFKDGKLVRREVDSGGNGRPDVVYLYENEVIALEERDGHGRGRPSFRASYQNGRVGKVEKDTDGDGKIDLWVYYDPTGNGEVVLKEEKDLNGDGLVDLWSYYEKGRLARRDVSAAGLEVLSQFENRDLPLPSGAVKDVRTNR